MSTVVNARFYNVYYQWFGCGVDLHHGMARSRFSEELFMKESHVKHSPEVDRYK